ncbi:DUF6957 family protein [Stutzerimonas kunmingensis]|uniref:DUF6957 family protein n=1 Tax=Stutzerimonas kunmingensis TaxID=1211807 RepID=UPI0024201053|nr:hypothetical protein [Stutzerimonas kunmingensis]
MDELSAVTDLLYGPGTAIPGLSLTDEEAMAMVRQRFPRAEFCLVRDWLWLDLEVTPVEREQLSKTGRQPVVVYAHTVIYDSNRRWDVDGRSQLSYHGDERRWRVVGDECLLNSVARGQEFVFDTQGQDAPVQWILSLLEASSSSK